ncbi:MAG: MAPEG family protein [Beijerinckiaceae bacterium]
MTIALWCVLLAALLPVVSAGIAKSAGGAYDNADPRGRASSYEGLAKRAHAAHLNGFEAFPLFAAAVLVAELKGGPRGMVDALAVVYISARVGYVGLYLLDKPALRSLVWAIAFFCAIAIFVSPLWR